MLKWNEEFSTNSEGSGEQVGSEETMKPDDLQIQQKRMGTIAINALKQIKILSLSSNSLATPPFILTFSCFLTFCSLAPLTS